MTAITRLIPTLDTPAVLQERRLLAELRVLERARAAGAVNRPASHAVTPCEIEVEITTRFQETVEDAAQWLAERMRKTASAIAADAPSETERDVREPVETARFEIEKLRDERREAITAAMEAAERRELELRHFQRSNDLTHRRPAPTPGLATALSVVGVLVLESIVQAPLLVDAAAAGAVGGIGLAVAFASINALLGFVLAGAIGLRHLRHVRVWLRVLGLLVLTVAAATTLGYNALAATYRSLLAADPEGATAAAAFSALVERPELLLDDTQSLQLFLIGCFSALLFAVEGGFLYADPYPGYAPYGRRRAAALEALDGAIAELRAAATGVAEAHADEIDARVAAVEARTRRALDLLNRAEVDVQTAQSAALRSRHAAQRAVMAQRAENAAVRTTPAPARFAEPAPFDDRLHGVPAFDLPGQRETLKARLAALRLEARAAKEVLRALAVETLAAVRADAEAAASEASARMARDRGLARPALPQPAVV